MFGTGKEDLSFSWGQPTDAFSLKMWLHIRGKGEINRLPSAIRFIARKFVTTKKTICQTQILLACKAFKKVIKSEIKLLLSLNHFQFIVVLFFLETG